MPRRYLCLVILLASCKDTPTASVPLLEAEQPTLDFAIVTPFGTYDETSVAVNTASPNVIAASWQRPATVGVSQDGGLTWTATQPYFAQFGRNYSDPSVLFDRDGGLYLLYLDFQAPRSSRTLGVDARPNSVAIVRSDDNGRSWRTPTAIVAHTTDPAPAFEDKPAAAIDRTSGSNGGTIHVAWTKFRPTSSDIFYAHSTDRGATFSAPIQISDRPGAPADTVGAAEGTDVAIASDGTVYVVWSDGGGIWIDRSTDGGRTWGSDVLVSVAQEMFFKVTGLFRANGFPSVSVDQSSGRVYVVWVDNRSGTFQPHISYSDDRGRTWSRERLLLGALSGTTDRFFATMAIDPSNGYVHVAYYRAEIPGQFAFYIATSADHGASFTEWRWSTPASIPQGGFIGDYVGIDAHKGIAYTAWTRAQFNPDNQRVSNDIWVGRALFP